jgi:hypothetical protein
MAKKPKPPSGAPAEEHPRRAPAWMGESPWKTAAIVAGVLITAFTAGAAIPKWLDSYYTPLRAFNKYVDDDQKVKREIEAQLVENQLSGQMDRIAQLVAIEENGGTLTSGQLKWKARMEKRRDELAQRLKGLRAP